MSKAPFAAIVSDLDGTLCDDNHNVSPENCRQLIEEVETGVHVAIATARPYGYLEYILPDSLLRRVWKICHNGAQLFNPRGEIVHKHLIEPESKARLLQDIGGRYTAISWYSDSDWLSCHETTAELRSAYGISAEFPGPRYCAIEGLLDRSVEKILVLGTEADHQRLATSYPDLLIYRSRNVNLLMISSGKADKAIAATAFLDAAGCSWAQTLAIGDDLNDLPLFKMAGTSIAMASAPDELVAAASLRGPSNNDKFGIARLIRSLRELC